MAAPTHRLYRVRRCARLPPMSRVTPLLAAALCALAACEDGPDGLAPDGAPPPIDAFRLPDFGDAGVGCEAAVDCLDDDPCTVERCEAGRCVADKVEPVVERALITFARPVTGLSVRGDRLFVARGADGIQVWDLAGLPDEPPREASVRQVIGEERSFDAVFAGDALLYVVDAARTVRLVSRETRAALGAYAAGDRVTDVLFLPQLSILAVYGDGVEIVDPRDPADPTRRSRADTPGRAMALARQGDALYVADGLAGLSLVDIADRGAPALSPRTVPTEGRAVDVATAGALLALAEEAGGLGVIARDGPLGPQRLATVHLPDPVTAVAMPDGRTVIAAAGPAIRAYDLARPEEPAEWLGIDFEQPVALFDADGLRLAAGLAGDGGVDRAWIVDVVCPAPPETGGDDPEGEGPE